MSPIHPVVGGYSRAGDIAGLLGDYSNLMDHMADKAAPSSTSSSTPPQPTLWRVAIDKPSRGVRAFNALTSARQSGNLNVGKALPSRPDPDDQGNMPVWNRLHQQDYAALEAIPGNNHAEQPVQPERAYLRRVGDDAGQGQPQAALAAALTPPPATRTESALAARMADRYRANLLRLCSNVGAALPLPGMATLNALRPLAVAR